MFFEPLKFDIDFNRYVIARILASALLSPGRHAVVIAPRIGLTRREIAINSVAIFTAPTGLAVRVASAFVRRRAAVILL
jgi:hypothetical protein